MMSAVPSVRILACVALACLVANNGLCGDASIGTNHEFSGRVLKPDGAPWPGVSVTIFEMPGKGERRLPALTTFGRPQAVSGEDGAFTVRSMGDWASVIIAYTEDGCRAAAAIRPGSENTIELVPRPGRDVMGRVIDGAGRSVPDVEVRVYHNLFGRLLGVEDATSAEDGSFVIEDVFPGEWMFEARVNELLGGDEVVRVPAAGDVRPVEIVLPQSGAVVGRIGGMSVADLRDTVILLDGDVVGRASVSGWFRVDGVPLGHWTVAAQRESTGITGEAVTVDLQHQDQVVEVGLEFGRVFTVGGRAQCGAVGAPEMRVELYGPEQRATSTDRDGRWEVRELAAGYYTVEYLDSTGLRVFREDVLVEENTFLTTELNCYQLAGEVRTPAGAPVPGATVSLATRGRGMRLMSVDTDHRGHYSFDCLPPGRFVVTAEIGDSVSDDYLVDLLDRRFAVDIELEVVVGLSLQVYEPTGEPASAVTLRAMAGPMVLPEISGECDDSGLCRFADLEFGVYHCMVKGWSGSAAIRVAVPSDLQIVHLVENGVLEIRTAPDVRIDGQIARVETHTGIRIPPGSFLGRSAWQFINGLVTLELPAGDYFVDVVTADGSLGMASVTVPPGGRAAVVLGNGN